MTRLLQITSSTCVAAFLVLITIAVALNTTMAFADEPLSPTCSGCNCVGLQAGDFCNLIVGPDPPICYDYPCFCWADAHNNLFCEM